MSVHDAKPGDVYTDGNGKLWRVVGVCGEPTVIVQEIETLTPDNPVKRSGGVSGYMWHDFTRILRPKVVEMVGKTIEGIDMSDTYCEQQRRKAFRRKGNFKEGWTEEEWIKVDRHIDPLTGTIVYHSYSDYCD